MIRHCAFTKSLLSAAFLTSFVSGIVVRSRDDAPGRGHNKRLKFPGGARVPGQTTARIQVDLEHSEPVKTLHIAVGRSLVLTTKTPLKRILCW